MIICVFLGVIRIFETMYKGIICRIWLHDKILNFCPTFSGLPIWIIRQAIIYRKNLDYNFYDNKFKTLILSANSGRIFWFAVGKWQEKRHGYSISAIAQISAIFILDCSGLPILLYRTKMKNIWKTNWKRSSYQE